MRIARIHTQAWLLRGRVTVRRCLTIGLDYVVLLSNQCCRSIDVIVDDGPSSYSALAFLPNGGGEGGTVVDAYAFSTTGNLNESLRSDPTQPLGGIRLAKVLQL